MNDDPARPGAVRLMRGLGLEPDPWQVEVLQAGHPRLLLNCCRQAGKSTVVAMLALAHAVFVPFTKVLLLSRSHRQSTELFRIVTGFYARLGYRDWHLGRISCSPLEMTNGTGLKDICSVLVKTLDQPARN